MDSVIDVRESNLGQDNYIIFSIANSGVKPFLSTLVARISQKSAGRTGRIYTNGNEATDYKRRN